MVKNKYSVIGVMSGTSLDGVDVIHATFNFDTIWNFTINYKAAYPYNDFWYERLKNLVTYTSDVLDIIDDEYTCYLAEVIKKFVSSNNIKNIDAICSHGHTALHQPQKKMTYQIGNKSKLAQLLKATVVCDFRIQDVALGGQGAPLVPIGDKLLFSKYDFCLNLGGFANISTELNDKRIAYDICPVNIVLNHYTSLLGLSYDDEGKIAKGGNLYTPLLEDLNNLQFYHEKPPKSLGLEWVKEIVFPIVNRYHLEVKDVLRTFVEHISIQISKEINKKKNTSVLVTGGGAYNRFLMNRIEFYSHNKIIIPSNDLVEYKEALIFGFLGVLKLRNETNTLSSVTGAIKNHSAGEIYFPE